MRAPVSRFQTIYLHREAPPKPPTGEACNGCGLCCAAEPCPLGIVVSRRRQGACAALQWQAQPPRYVCGLLADPRRHLPAALAFAAPALRAVAARGISAGSGCDAELEPVAASPDRVPPT